jgi:hypothetical protein
MVRELIVIVAVLALAGVVWGALPPLSPERLKEEASHIVVGEVRVVYSAERAGERGGFVDRVYCIEVMPSAMEKGEGLKEGRVIFARTWRPAKRPAGWAGPQGQDVIPEAGKRVRVYLVEGKDGGMDLVGPNGVEVLK